MKNTIYKSIYLSLFISLVISVKASKFSVPISDWNTISARAYYMTSNSSQAAYRQLRGIQAYPQHLDNFNSWQNYLLPSFIDFVQQTKNTEKKVQPYLKELIRLAGEIDKFGTSDVNYSKRKNNYNLNVNKLITEINSLQKKASIHVQDIKKFADRNQSMNYAFKRLSNSQSNRITPNLSAVENSIGLIRGVINAIRDDLNSLQTKTIALKNFNVLLVDLQTEDVVNTWNNLKEGILEFGKNMKRKGWHVNVVEYSGGRFYQSSGNKWKEKNQRGTYNFEEYNRDEWSVYLYDRSRNYYIQLDLWTKKVNQRSASQNNYSFLYSIIKDSNRTNGRILNGVVCKLSDGSKRQFVKRGSLWIEKDYDSEQSKFTFSETGRDDWSVYLYDRSRDVYLQLDVHRMKVGYRRGNRNQIDLYTIDYSY